MRQQPVTPVASPLDMKAQERKTKRVTTKWRAAVITQNQFFQKLRPI